jgi:hypothetical protein
MKKLILHGLSVILFLLPLIAVGGGGYQQSDDARTVRNNCGSYLDTWDITGLARCLGRVKRDHLPNKSICDVVDIAAGEACANRWGFLGQDHKNCKYSRNGGGFIYNYSLVWWDELGANCN